MLKVKVTKLAETILPLIYADIPVLIRGKTGIGKSWIVNHDIKRALERKYGMEVVVHDYRLSQKVHEDATGMPVIDKDNMTTSWTRSPFIPIDDGKFHLFFIDEFGHASVQLQQMMYQFVNDRELGGYKLPKYHRIVLATNTREDHGGDNKTLQPLENRVAHVEAEVDHPGFIEKMKEWNWDKRLIAFLTVRPEEIHKVSNTDPAFPTPRSNAKLNDVLQALPIDAPKGLIENAALAIVGEGYSRQFMTFLANVAAGLPKMEEIKANPTSARVPGDTHFQTVLAGAIAKNINPSNVKAFATYLARLNPEPRSLAAHEAIGKYSELRSALEHLIQ